MITYDGLESFKSFTIKTKTKKKRTQYLSFFFGELVALNSLVYLISLF